MSISEVSSEQCFGCRACEKKCPRDAIKLVFDESDFLFPVIDFEKCDECNLCSKVCPVENFEKLKRAPNTIYAAWNTNDRERINSASGGVFIAIAKAIVERGGIVYGAAYDHQWYCRHTKAETFADLPILQNSKYTQSDTLSTFKEVKEYLAEGRWVYYAGTPCQITGLRLYLGKEHDKLLTSDLICHGVPSPKMFQQEVRYWERLYGKKLHGLSYRSKERFGWGCDIALTFEKGTIYRNSMASQYFADFMFYRNLRPSCYICPFRTVERVGDITLADFWGARKTLPQVGKTAKGISRIFTNTEKGLSFFKAVTNLERMETELSVAEHGLRGVGRVLPNENSIMRARIQEIPRNIIKSIVLWKYWK